MSIDVEDAIRRRIIIDGESYYILMGKDFTQLTGAFENRRNNKPISMETAMIINEAITELAEKFNER